MQVIVQQHMAVMPERMKASRVIKRFQCNGPSADLAQPRLACVAYEGQEHGASRDEMAVIAWHAESVPIPPGKDDREKRRCWAENRRAHVLTHINTSQFLYR